MCTAITYKTKNHYFGRNLDYEFSYNETVTITPRNKELKFRHVDALKKHYAMIGMSYVVDNYPLYYDATNEKGLSMAGLNFVGNASYNKLCGNIDKNVDNIATFEFIPWILGQCENIMDVKELLNKINLTDESFNENLPASQLHWIIADKDSAITVESVKDGIKIYDNEIGVLTNNPPFDYQIFNLNNYMSLSTEAPQNHFSDRLNLKEYSRGMGAIGLPGDLSSASRFVRAAFTKLNSFSGDSESESISQFFHILLSVAQQRGCVHMGNGKYEITIYSSCCNTDKGIYYYITYENSQITAVDMYNENLDSDKLVSYPLVKNQQIKIQNM